MEAGVGDGAVAVEDGGGAEQAAVAEGAADLYGIYCV